VRAPFAALLSSEAADEYEAQHRARAASRRPSPWAELDELLVARRASRRTAARTCGHLAEVKMLEVLGAETGLAASDAAVDAQLREIENAGRASATKGGLEKMLREKRRRSTSSRPAQARRRAGNA
jgi:hypothetical protein